MYSFPKFPASYFIRTAPWSRNFRWETRRNTTATSRQFNMAALHISPEWNLYVTLFFRVIDWHHTDTSCATYQAVFCHLFPLLTATTTATREAFILLLLFCNVCYFVSLSNYQQTMEEANVWAALRLFSLCMLHFVFLLNYELWFVFFRDEGRVCLRIFPLVPKGNVSSTPDIVTALETLNLSCPPPPPLPPLEK